MVHIIISGLQLEVSKFIIDNFNNDNSTAFYEAKIISELTTSQTESLSARPTKQSHRTIS